MRKTWKIYNSTSQKQNKQKKEKQVFILSHSFFQIIQFDILPAIDEEDRRQSVFSKLEERFLDVKELSFLYFETIKQEVEKETIFCCYLKGGLEKVSLPTDIEVAVPSFLLGKCYSVKENYIIIEYDEKSLFFCVYERGKIHFWKRILREEENFFVSFRQSEILSENSELYSVILLGAYTQDDFLYWKRYFHIKSIENISFSKISKEVDIFHHTRIQRIDIISWKKCLPIIIGLAFIGGILLGFYFQYRIEEQKEVLLKVEEETRRLEIQIHNLEEKMIEIQKTQEVQEEKKFKPLGKKIGNTLAEIYHLAHSLDILSLEYLETGHFKLVAYCDSPREYLSFFRKLLSAHLEFINHDSVQYEEGRYKIEIEVKKADL